MAEDYAEARRTALRAAARQIADYLREVSPSDWIRTSWRVSNREDVSYLRNSAVSALATERDWRHFQWGREPQVPTNRLDPARTHWASRAVLEAADRAEEEFKNEYLRSVAVESKYFDYEP